MIPSDYFFTKHDEPQVKVSVDGLPALCTGLKCGYSYIEGQEIITSYSVSGNRLEVRGTDLTEPNKIEMGYIECKNIDFDANLG